MVSEVAPFTPGTTTFWSFPDRGDRATHVGNYRGNWSVHPAQSHSSIHGAGNKDLCGDEAIDFIATLPPYASIIPYSHDREGDLSSVHNITEFAAEMRTVAVECMRVLRPGKHCAILMGDSRRNKHFVPITPRVLMSFLEAGFILRVDIIKMQWKMKSTREKWFGKKYDFYLIGHEHLYVFRKPEAGERTTKFRESMKWW